MTIREFIEKVKAEANIPTNTDDIRDYVIDKARAMAMGNVAVVDDDTVKNWILECREGIPKKEAKAEKTADIQALKEKAVKEAEVRAERPTTQKAKTWEMESLF